MGWLAGSRRTCRRHDAPDRIGFRYRAAYLSVWTTGKIMTDREANRFAARATRYARVGANMGGVAARIAGARLFGFGLDRERNAMELAPALGGLKGPIMKVAQLMATIPVALPPEYVAELQKLQSE